MLDGSGVERDCFSLCISLSGSAYGKTRFLTELRLLVILRLERSSFAMMADVEGYEQRNEEIR
jgi:hypothetical protein